MQLPKISIVTPSYNQGGYLEETILSVIEQGYPNLEYIIIDGGSTDNSIEIIKKYEKHLAYWTSEKDKGMYDAIQKGFEKSTGEIMAWINSDDWYHKKTFFVVSEIFSRFKNVQWLQGLPSIADDSGRIVYVNDMRDWLKYDFLLGDYQFIQQESCFWRRSLWEKSGAKLNTSLRYAGDFALWLNFFGYAELYCLHTVLGIFRVRGKNQLSVQNKDEYIAEAEKLLADRKKNLLKGEGYHLFLLSFYRNLIYRIPFLRRLYYRYLIQKIYPSAISFDMVSQQFIMIERKPLSIYQSLKSRLNKQNQQPQL